MAWPRPGLVRFLGLRAKLSKVSKEIRDFSVTVRILRQFLGWKYRTLSLYGKLVKQRSTDLSRKAL